ncbi:TetR/AcrR family transcriptional regulator [Domibacillus sp.]|uniref:TetR/AcrR family transcriptional regulator n=1 Tax=Domibacillus sp. TaxID=1969783 RepID=UPI002811B59E|nr:TetR/AcrR family transcriptional regulator [Domibacillus sp.]
MKTKERIIKEAFEQFTIKGYEGTSMFDISNAVGISKSTMYSHFKDKESLYCGVLQNCVDVWESIVADKVLKYNDDLSPDEKLYNIYKGLIEISAQNRDIVQFWKRAKYFPPASIDIHSLIGKQSDLYITLIQSVFEEGIRRKVFKDLKPVDLTINLICLIEGIQLFLLRNNDYSNQMYIGWKNFCNEVAVENIPVQ